MNLSGTWKYAGLLLLVAVCCCSANQSKNFAERRTPTDLNVSVPINKIADKLIILLKKGLNVQLLVDTIVQLIGCLSKNETVTATVVPIPIKLQDELNVKIQNFVLNFNNTIPKENITAYCNSDNFVTIHNYLWVGEEDLQFRDFIKFLNRFGYPRNYESFKDWYNFYECREGLVDDIKPIPSKVRISSQSQYKPTNIRSQALSANSPDNAFQLTADCNFQEMLTNLLQTGILELLQLVETIIEQVNTDPSLQFTIGKIQEPIKGPSFRKFRLLIPVRDLLDKMNEAFINDPAISLILDLAQKFLGLDLKEINILETILNILEGILWGNFQPVPPRN